MTPLKDSFGEEWLEMDDNVEDAIESIANGQEDTSLEDESLKITESKAKKESDSPYTTYSTSGFKSSSNRDDMDRREVNSTQLHKENNGFGSKYQHFKLGEQKTALKLSKEKLEEWSRPCRGSGKKPPLLRRVMSEERLTRRQVMVSKIDCVQEDLSKRGCSMAKKWGKRGDMEECMRVEGKKDKNKETLVEVEFTIKKWTNMEPKAVMEGEETLVVYMPPLSLSDTHMHRVPLEAVVGHEMNPKSMAPKADQKDKHQESVQATPRSLDGNGMERAKSGAKMQPRATDKAEKPSKTSEEGHMEAKMPSKVKDVVQGSMEPLEVSNKEEEWLQSEHGGRKQAKVGRFKVKEVECECCGVGEECTTGYIEHVKGLFSGHWVCGLCAEAVHEERHRLGRGVPVEEAVRTHMNMCKQFSAKKQAGELPHSPGVAHAVCHLLSRHLSDPTGPRHATTSPIRPHLSRTSSCLPSFSKNPP